VQDGDIGATSTVHGGLHAKEDCPFLVTQLRSPRPMISIQQSFFGQAFQSGASSKAMGKFLIVSISRFC